VNAPRRSGQDKTATRAKSGKGPNKCPICGKPASQAYQPFCGRTCADVDLGRWLEGRYAVPGEPVADRGNAEAED